ncbi:MAG TPA: ribose 5-phosphate isomerase B [Persephonella sp.]|uniref:Ribose 5-phosphate isomerase B n=1 Tax=Persephonella marina (strain DSM 14350 / EX-H1) TaxID=123214 RepID=C0QQE3_PERMH|nr:MULTISPECIES: ribose 5-phosphate isomerase B [Persephonella]ACO04760.1 ribose 5-phosphate isomerase B [Persephonella marina EX-H1]HCB69505.1 ribose 5-phosphate isomerase B [Persephonella sp.]
MKISIGSDHAGFELKEIIKDHLQKKGYEVVDKGTYSKESVDYPLFGEAVGRSVSEGETDRGIVICGTGIGISISANKIKGVRAALCTNEYMARMSRKHNDANVLALGSRVLGIDLALSIVDTFLSTDFEGGRHERRVHLIQNIEKINL